MFDKIFDNIGETLKSITKVVFALCVLIGIFAVIGGSICFFAGINEYTTISKGLTCTLEDAVDHPILYQNCYYGRQITKYGLISIGCAFGTLPLYAFGELVQLTKDIKENKKDN